MAAQDRFLRKEFQGSGSNSARAALTMRRGLEKMIGEVVHTAIAVVVKNYSAQLQRVTLVEKCAGGKAAATYHNIPIMGSGNTLSHLVHYETLDSGSSRPTSGILLFTKEQTSDAWKSFGQSPAPNGAPFDSSGVFIPGPLIAGDAMPVPGAGGLPNGYEAGDEAMIDRRTGSFILFKANGDLIIKAKGDVYIGGTDQDIETSDFKDAARKGDEGDGLGGSIAGGSSRVHVGN